MKKLLFILSSAALCLLAVSCNRGAKAERPAEYPVASHASEAMKLVVTDQAAEYDLFEMTESGLYVVRKARGGALKTGAYTVAAEGRLYRLQGLGTLEVTQTRSSDLNPTVIVFTEDGKEALTLTVRAVSAATPATASILGQLSDSWIPEKTVISVSGGNLSASLGVAHATDGCDLPAIKQYMYENKVMVNADLDGYVVTDITFTEAGTLMIRFTEREPYYGAFEMDSEGNFRYEFDGTLDGNPILNGAAEGKVLLVDGMCYLKIKSHVDADAGYNAGVEIQLKRKV